MITDLQTTKMSSPGKMAALVSGIKHCSDPLFKPHPFEILPHPPKKKISQNFLIQSWQL